MKIYKKKHILLLFLIIFFSLFKMSTTGAGGDLTTSNITANFPLNMNNYNIINLLDSVNG